MFEWAVPWSTAEQIDFLFLVLSTMVITAVPVVYGLNANLRDPLARAVLSGTGATAAAFITLIVFTVAVHAGWAPPEIVRHWIVRGMYFTVAGGKAILLMAILTLLRVSRNQRRQSQ